MKYTHEELFQLQQQWDEAFNAGNKEKLERIHCGLSKLALSDRELIQLMRECREIAQPFVTEMVRIYSVSLPTYTTYILSKKAGFLEPASVKWPLETLEAMKAIRMEMNRYILEHMEARTRPLELRTMNQG
jgi:hypothetical protein